MTESTSLPQLKRTPTLDELAYTSIKQAIIAGVFEPGEFLAEVQVAHDLGISKTPVRKALGRLQQERFLVNVPFEGYYVAEISGEDIAQVYELRVVLECFLVRETIHRFSAAELDELQAMLDSAGMALQEGDHLRFVDLNREFHHAFDRKHGNRRISDMLANLDEHVQRILLRVFAGNQEDLAASHREHYQILAALRERDSEAASHIMRIHLQQFCDALIARQGTKAERPSGAKQGRALASQRSGD